MSAVAWPLQEAIFAALETALSPVVVYDGVPQGTVPLPYVTIGEDTSRDWSTKTENGEEATIVIHTWSHAAGRKETKQLQATIYATLHNQPLAVTGYKTCVLMFDFGDTVMDEDGVTRHGVSRFRALLCKTV